MFKWAVLLFFVYIFFYADQSMIYETEGYQYKNHIEEDNRKFRPEVYDEPDFLADCLEYKMELCYEPVRKRAKF